MPSTTGVVTFSNNGLTNVPSDMLGFGVNTKKTTK